MPRADAHEPLLDEQSAAAHDSDGDSDDSRWRRGDIVLAAVFAAVGTVLLGIALAPGIEVAAAAQCKPDAVCDYIEGYAMKDGLTGAAEADSRTSCCSLCSRAAGCAAATFMNATGTCLLYSSDAERRVPFDGAAVCALPASDASDPVGTTRSLAEALLGASALTVRFGGLALVFLVGQLQDMIGYDGASLAQSVLKPRQAAITAAALAAARFAPEGRGRAPDESMAGWGLIAEPGETPPVSWTEARRGLGLSVRQAVWSCGTRLLLWHWIQPLSYFAVFAAYYCVISGEDEETTTSWNPSADPDHAQRSWGSSQRALGLVVAAREVAYLVCTVLALRLNPAFLLLELEDFSLSDNGNSLKQWVLYLLAPHHYVTISLIRWVRMKHKTVFFGVFPVFVPSLSW